MPKPLDLEALRSDLAFVEAQLARHPDSDDTIRLMWEHRRDAIQEELTQIDSQENRYAQVALLFKGPPVIGSSDIQLDFTAKVLEHYQAVVGTFVAEQAGVEIGARGKLPQSWTSKLYVRDMVRGSVGFLLEEPAPRQGQLLDSALKEAVARASRILGDLSGANSSAAEETLAGLNPRAVSALKNLAKVLRDAGTETRIVTEGGELSLGQERTATLHSRLTELEIAERREERRGQILGSFRTIASLSSNPKAKVRSSTAQCLNHSTPDIWPIRISPGQ